MRIAVTSLIALALLSAACGNKVDHSDPKSVVSAIFSAAKGGDTGALAGLCDPQGENDGDTKRICGVTKGGKDWERFQQAFKDSAVKGEPRVSGTQAEVDISIGPGGEGSETVKLVQRDGKWYLYSM